MRNKKTIVLIETGGTIVSVGHGVEGASPELSSADLIQGAPEGISLMSHQVLNEDSSVFTLAQMQTIVAASESALSDPDVIGVVVLHGTDSMEETSFLAEIQHRSNGPIVFTGAQLTADDPDSDGPANLAFAIQTAMNLSAEGRNDVVVAFANRLFRPSGTYKRYTDKVDAFEVNPAVAASPGYIGPYSDSVRVDVVYLTPGANPCHVEASITDGANGIVLQALGSGNTSPEVVAAVRKATEAGVPVVVSSRVPEGELSATYGGGGGGADLVKAGAIISKGLRSSQARVLLACLLSQQADLQTMRSAFA